MPASALFVAWTMATVCSSIVAEVLYAMALITRPLRFLLRVGCGCSVMLVLAVIGLAAAILIWPDLWYLFALAIALVFIITFL